MVETFIECFDLDDTAANVPCTLKLYMTFALRQSTAHQLILFYSKVGMFFFPTVMFCRIKLYQQFTINEFEKFQDNNKMTDALGRIQVCNVPTLFAFIVVSVQDGWLKVYINGSNDITDWDSCVQNQSNCGMHSDGMPHKRQWYSNIAKVEFDIFLDGEVKNTTRISIEEMMYLFSYGCYPFEDKLNYRIGGMEFASTIKLMQKLLKRLLKRNYNAETQSTKPLWDRYAFKSRGHQATDRTKEEAEANAFYSKQTAVIESPNIATKDPNAHKEQYSNLSRKRTFQMSACTGRGMDGTLNKMHFPSK